VRFALDDAGFTALVTAKLAMHLEQAKSRMIVVAHHPPFYGLSFPREGPPVELDSYLWDAFAGNVGVEQLLTRHAERISHVFCGHTHNGRGGTCWGRSWGTTSVATTRSKRLLVLDWPSGDVEEHQFGEV